MTRVPGGRLQVADQFAIDPEAVHRLYAVRAPVSAEIDPRREKESSHHRPGGMHQVRNLSAIPANLAAVIKA